MVYNELDEYFLPMEDVETSKLIGSGATSDVYIGQFRFCQVAVKKINLASLNQKQLINIVNEMSCMNKIKHPNAVTFYGVAMDNNQTIYMILDLCEQLSLKSFFKKFKSKIPYKVKLKIIFDIAKALYHIHGEKPAIIHRDLKPENVFLTGDLKAKVGDFG